MTPRQHWKDETTLGRANLSDWVPDDPPFQLSYLWRWFIELHKSRHFGPNGAKQITYADMLAWSQLTDRKLTQFEITVVRQLDQRFFYVLQTPNGISPQFFDSGGSSDAAEREVASALRMMAKRNEKGRGLAPLTKGVASVGSSKK